MDGTGHHHINWNNPDSEKQVSPVSFTCRNLIGKYSGK